MLLLIGLAMVLLILFLFILLFIFGFIHISFEAKYVKNHPDVTVKILLWKLRLATFRLSEMKMDAFPMKFFFKGKLDTSIKNTMNKKTLDKEDFKKLFETWETVASKIKSEGELTDEILGIFRIHDIKWTTTLGLDEAHLTALAVGMAWAVKYNLIGRLMEWLKGMERPLVDVRPAYQVLTFQTHIKCMITFRLGKAILAAYRIAKIRKRRQVGQCQNIQYKA